MKKIIGLIVLVSLWRYRVRKSTDRIHRIDDIETRRLARLR